MASVLHVRLNRRGAGIGQGNGNTLVHRAVRGTMGVVRLQQTYNNEARKEGYTPQVSGFRLCFSLLLA